ncbi:MAG: glycosyltransferase [Butyrivibrio sp.]|uniref:glycosyltransferase n=1 Tax=Butyrivibrio sp. TaxID=28121 RepID=UPI001B1C60BB|nr:glycosyltransferase [Butyrivibrio sp.]MBO6242195.1 glycosyltransferase [Butyrivibrio sp.]
MAVSASEIVSIIVPVYNASLYIEETIDSVIEQTFTNWELILVDDCSTDNSYEVISRKIANFDDEKKSQNQRIVLLKNEANSGAAKTRNNGIDAATGRFIAFLDADDIWHPDKLQNEILFMQKHKAAFVFSGYEFGDENAHPTGKVVHVPKKLDYNAALSRTVIFTSTVLIDTDIIDKELCHMPEIGSEDTATWWNILGTGVVAYGLDQALVTYRRPAKSLSSNKNTAVKRIWNLYRNHVGLTPVSASIYLFLWAFRATYRRIVTDTIHNHIESARRFTVVQLSTLGLIINTAIYAYTWFDSYYPAISAIRISQDGYVFGAGLKLYFKGHILILFIYFVLLLFCSKQVGATKTGYFKPSNIFVSEAAAIIITNVITYFQLSLMRNWLLPVRPILNTAVLQFLAALIWAFLADAIYRRVFPPSETLIISEGDLQSLWEKFGSRKDRFNILKTMNLSSGIEQVKKECLRWYGSIVVGEMDLALRNELVDFCYRHYIRVYILPDIQDIILQASDQMNLFDAPMLEIKEYNVRWDTRCIVRTMDVLMSGFLMVLAIPLWISRFIINKDTEMGTVIKTPSIGKNERVFEQYSFGGKADNGLSRANKKFPVLFNVFTGTMSVFGPKSVTVNDAEIARKQNPKYSYRFRVKPGIISYADVYSTDKTTEDEKLRMDIFYIQNYSISLNMKLLLMYIKKVMTV